MKCLEKQTFNGCKTGWVCYPLRYLMAGLSAENMIETLEDENENLRAEIERLEGNKPKQSTTNSRKGVFDIFTSRMPVRPPRSLPRHTILDQIYSSFSLWSGRPQEHLSNNAASLCNNAASLCNNADGDIRGDISAILEEDDWMERRLAFRYIYGIEYEAIKDAIMHHSEELDLLVDMCNIRGTVQVRLPRSEPEDRDDMQNIRELCDQVIKKWDGRSTEYWNTHEIDALVDELQDGLEGWVVVSPTET